MRIGYMQELRGRTVIDATGLVLGEVDDIHLDSDTWQVATIRVKIRRDATTMLGLPRPLLHAPHLDLPAEQVQSVGQTVVLRCSGQDFVPATQPSNDVPEKATGT